MRLVEIIKDRLMHNSPMNLWEMANLGPKNTGIPNYVIWISSGQGVRHGPRIKVVRGVKWNPNESATIPLTGMPRVIGDIGITQDEFSKIVDWININRQLLLQYWDGDMLTSDFIEQMKKITTE